MNYTLQYTFIVKTDMIGCNVVKLFTPAVFFKDMGSIPGKCKHRTPDMFSNVYTIILTYATYGCVIWISEHTCYYCSLILFMYN